MADVQSLRELLAEVYGICSDKDLDEAICKMKIDIGIFVSPVKPKGGNQNEPECYIA